MYHKEYNKPVKLHADNDIKLYAAGKTTDGHLRVIAYRLLRKSRDGYTVGQMATALNMMLGINITNKTAGIILNDVYKGVLGSDTEKCKVIQQKKAKTYERLYKIVDRGE